MNKSSKTKQKQNKSSTSNSKRDCIEVAPLARGITRYSSLPKIGAGYDRVTIKRREFVGTLTNGSTVNTFYLTPGSTSIPGYDFNPGSAIMFPWLSAIAPNYERYAFRKLSFDFLPAQSANTNGRYYVGVDYDYDDNPASLKSQLMGNRTSAEAPVWQSLHIDCVTQELHRDNPTKFISSGARNNFIEPRTAYCGFLMVAIETPTTNLIIDLWVDYEVDLISPVSDNFVVMDTYSNYSSLPAATNLTTAFGTGFVGYPPALATAAGAVKQVLAGAAGTPTLYSTLFGSTIGLNNVTAYDLKEARRGTLNVYTDCTVTGATPSATIGTDGFRVNAAVCDQNGNYLGSASTGSVLADITSGSRDTPANLLVASAQIRSGISIFLSRLYSAFPLARFIVPYISSINALGAGTAGHGIKYEL